MDIFKPIKKLKDLKIVNTSKSLVVEEEAKIAEVKKLLEIQEVFSSSRPDQNVDRWTNEGVLAQSYFPYDDYAVYELYLYSTELRIAIGHVNNETLRPGYELTPKVEFASDEQKKRAEEFILRANGNNQSLQEVSLQLAKDVDIFDDMFGVLAKDYFVDPEGNIIGGEVQEFFRISPVYTDFLFSKDNQLGYDYNGRKIYFDIQDRSVKTYDSFNKKTDMQNMEAHFRVRSGEMWKYYNASEIIHCSLHEPSLTRGHSPIRPLYNKVMSLIGMDYTIEKYYDKNERQPRSMLFINSTNYDTLLKWWEKMRDKVRRNPTATHPIPVNNADGRKIAEFVDMMKGLEEMQYTAVRDEIRRTIASFYGVSNLFLNDVSAGGGLNNEGLQLKVTNRAVEIRQRMWNEKVLPWIFEQMGITDWEITLKSSKEEDQSHEVDLFNKNLLNAEKMVQMGINVRFEEGEFIFENGSLEKTEEPALPVFQGKAALGANTSGASNATFNEEKKKKTVQVKKAPAKDTPVVPTARPEAPVNENVPKSAQEQFYENLEKELKVLTAGLAGKKLTKALLNKFSKTAQLNMEKKLKGEANDQMNDIYRDSARAESEKIGDKFKQSKDDKTTLESLKNDKNYQKGFKNLSKDASKRIKATVENSVVEGKIDPDKLREGLKEDVDATDSQLNTIIRTETTKVSEAARMTQYEKKGLDNFLFEHVGPNDKRTTKYSKGAKKATKGGVPWDDYVKAIEANKVSPDWTVSKTSPITHPNTRHVFTARPRGE